MRQPIPVAYRKLHRRYGALPRLSRGGWRKPCRSPRFTEIHIKFSIVYSRRAPLSVGPLCDSIGLEKFP